MYNFFNMENAVPATKHNAKVWATQGKRIAILPLLATWCKNNHNKAPLNAA